MYKVTSYLIEDVEAIEYFFNFEDAHNIILKLLAKVKSKYGGYIEIRSETGPKNKTQYIFHPKESISWSIRQLIGFDIEIEFIEQTAPFDKLDEELRNKFKFR